MGMDNGYILWIYLIDIFLKMDIFSPNLTEKDTTNGHMPLKIGKFFRISWK